MATILEKSNEILADKNANLLPENLKSGVKCLGVDGAFTGDATAIANDVRLGKTAYVGGEKIEGALNRVTYVSNASNDGFVNTANIDVVDVDGVQYFTITSNNPYMSNEETDESVVLTEGYIGPGGDNVNQVTLCKEVSEVAAAIGLTEDKIGYGETILGVNGAYGKNILFNDEYGTMCNLTSGAVVLPGELVSGGNIPDYEVEYLAAINNVYYDGTNLELDCVISFSADVQDVRAYGILDFNEGERMETERFDFDNSTIERFHNRINLTFRDVDIEQFVNDTMAISIIVETTLNDEN